MVPVTMPVWQAVAGTMLFLGGAIYFAYGGYTVSGEVLDIAGYRILDNRGVSFSLYVCAAASFLCFFGGCIGVARRLRGQQRIELDANRIVTYGLTISGEDKVVSLRDVSRMRVYKIRGIPVLELRARDGTKMEISSILFEDSADFEDLRFELETRLTAVGGGISAAS